MKLSYKGFVFYGHRLDEDFNEDFIGLEVDELLTALSSELISFKMHKHAKGFYNSSLKKWTLKKYTETGNSVTVRDPDVITIDSDDDDDSLIIDYDQNHEDISNTLKTRATCNESYGNVETAALPEVGFSGFSAEQKRAFCASRLEANGSSVAGGLLLEVDEDSCSVAADDFIKEKDFVDRTVSSVLPLSVIEINSDSNSSIENVIQMSSSQSNSTTSHTQTEPSVKPMPVLSVLQEHRNYHGTRHLNLIDNSYASNLKIPSKFQGVFASFCDEMKTPPMSGKQMKLNHTVRNGHREDHDVQQNYDSAKLPFATSCWHKPIPSSSSVDGGQSSCSDKILGNVSKSTCAEKSSNSKVKSSLLRSYLRPKTLLSKSVDVISDKSSVNNRSLSNTAKLNDNAPVRNKTSKLKKPLINHMTKNKGLRNGATYASCRKKEMKAENEKASKEKTGISTESSVIETGERAMAKTLMDLGRKLVTKEVISGIIEAYKRNLDLNIENKEVLLKYLTELKFDLRPFQFGWKACPCSRFKSESSNILLTHQGHGASFRIYRCCFCSRMTRFYRSFYSHMTKRHQIITSKLPRQIKYSCSLCSYDTNVFANFQCHQSQCVKEFCEDNNLYPHFEDFDIPVKYNNEQEKLVAKKILEIEKSRLKSILHKVNLKKSLKLQSERSVKSCNICGKTFRDGVSLGRHIRYAHRYTENKKPQFGQENGHCHATKNFKNRQTAKLSDKTVLEKHAYKCCFCSKLLGKDVLRHIRYMHHISLDTMVKKRYCYLCECSVDDVSCFESHMLSSHSELFPNYKILWKEVLSSFKTWRQNLSLKYDCTDNSLNKPWQCIQCDKCFVLPSSGYRHILLIHAVDKVECQVCGKMISSGASYTEHIQHHITPCHIALYKMLLHSS